MKETINSIVYKNHQDNLDGKFYDYQSQNLCFNIRFVSQCNISKHCSCLSSKSNRYAIYNTIDSYRRINDKLNEITILPDQKGLNKMNE